MGYQDAKTDSRQSGMKKLNASRVEDFRQEIKDNTVNTQQLLARMQIQVLFI